MSTKSSKPFILYDNRCLFCTSIRNRFSKLDWNKKLQWVGIDNFNYKKYNLKKENLLKEIHLIHNKRVYKGYFAFKFISKKIPLLFPLYLVMMLPGIDYLGKKVYKHMAKHRYTL